jgi:hypothetical protein
MWKAIFALSFRGLQSFALRMATMNGAGRIILTAIKIYTSPETDASGMKTAITG